MLRQWAIRAAAILTIVALSAPAAHAQIFFRPVVPYGPFGVYPYGGYGGYGSPYGGYGSPYGGYGTPYGYGGYGMPYGGGYGMSYGSYGTGMSYSSGYGASYYSPPTIVIATVSDSSGGPRSTLSPASAVAQDSPLLLAGYSEPTGDNRAVVVIQVPDALAKIWVEDRLTSQTGMIRRFVSPPLGSDRSYEYDIRAQWIDAAGKAQGYAQAVQVRAGGVVTVIFANK